MFYWTEMDWALYIERNRAPLLVEVLKLFALIGLTEGATIERIPRPLHRQVFGILRKAESAVRRLIVAAARDIVLEPEEPRQSRPRAKNSSQEKTKAEGETKEKRKRRPLFNLFEQLTRFRHRIKKKRGPEPRIRILGDPPDPRHRMYTDLGTRSAPPPPPPAPVVEEKAPLDDGMVSAKHLIRRLIAILDAVQDIPGHAMRLARWNAKPMEERRPERWSPLRSGRPPGFRQKARHVVDEILKECHWLAIQGHPPLDDTS